MRAQEKRPRREMTHPVHRFEAAKLVGVNNSGTVSDAPVYYCPGTLSLIRFRTKHGILLLAS